MQLGTRWDVGAEPPARIPHAMRAAIFQVESELGDAAADSRWTLTWLEGRPVVDLDIGSADAEHAGLTLRYDPATGTVTRTEE